MGRCSWAGYTLNRHSTSVQHVWHHFRRCPHWLAGLSHRQDPILAGSTLNWRFRYFSVIWHRFCRYGCPRMTIHRTSNLRLDGTSHRQDPIGLNITHVILRYQVLWYPSGRKHLFKKKLRRIIETERPNKLFRNFNNYPPVRTTLINKAHVNILSKAAKSASKEVKIMVEAKKVSQKVRMNKSETGETEDAGW